MRIAEIFQSIQGEGPLAGVESVFVRLSGCNLRCWFCDTPYTSFAPEGDAQSCDEVLASIRPHTAQHVVVTGGEPLLFPECVELTQRLRDLRQHITIETAGTVFRPVTADLMSISPKLPDSRPRNLPNWTERHERVRWNPDAIERLTRGYNYILKFVIESAHELDEVEQWLSHFRHIPHDRVWIMPQATSRAELQEKSTWLPAATAERGFQFSTRLHIEQFGNQRGT